MVQLSNDCFATDGGMMALDDALALLRERLVCVTDSETVALNHADGRILAQALISGRNVPPHANAAVDGYAVYFDDLAAQGESRLPVTGRIAAGHPLGRPARRGEALQVFTGCPMPAGVADSGPDTVFMIEDCRSANGDVILPPGLSRGANRRAAGEDVREGATVLEGGTVLDPIAIGLIAAIGEDRVAVRRHLRVALFSTGDEVRAPGTALPPGGIYDANRFALAAALQRLGCRVSDLGIVADDKAALGAALAGVAGDHDLLITSGGVSTGEEDHVRTALDELGGLDFWRLAIKPGRPLALGFVAADDQRVPLLALPGNPAAALVTFLLFARPLILALAGAAWTAPETVPVRLGFAHKKKPGRREFLRCRLSRPVDQELAVAVKAGRQGAGILTTMAKADGLVDLGQDLTSVEEGAMVRFLPFSAVL